MRQDTHTLALEKSVLFIGTLLLLLAFLLIPMSYKNISVGAGYSWRANGTLVKQSGADAIYVIENGFKKLIPSMSVFNALGYSTGNITTVSSDEMSVINTGSDVSSAFANTFRVIRQTSTDALYRLVNRIKRYIATMNIFTLLAYDSGDVEDVTADEFSHYVTDSVNEVTLPEFAKGELVKGATADAVYVVDEFGALRHITSADAFEAMGFSWSDIQTLTQAAVDDMDKGADIPES